MGEEYGFKAMENEWKYAVCLDMGLHQELRAFWARLEGRLGDCHVSRQQRDTHPRR